MGYSDERGVCGKCGDEYDPYIILWTKGFVNNANRAKVKREYGYVCPDCLNEEVGYGYAITEDTTT